MTGIPGVGGGYQMIETTGELGQCVLLSPQATMGVTVVLSSLHAVLKPRLTGTSITRLSGRDRFRAPPPSDLRNYRTDLTNLNGVR